MDFTQPLKLHTNACGSGLGAILYQTHKGSMDAVIAKASRSLTKAKCHYPTHKLEFPALKWAVVEKFHKYLYGSTFDVYTDNLHPCNGQARCNEPPVGGHPGQLQFLAIYRAGKAIIDADALSRVSWPGCMPDNSGTHLQVMTVVVQAIQKATLKGPTSPIKAYSCNLHILDSVQDSQHVTCMTIEDWHQTQQMDQTLNLVITRLWDGTMG